jgi:hypothetical protein
MQKANQAPKQTRAPTSSYIAGAEQFSAAGLRYPPEVAIHNELYAIKFISEISFLYSTI